MIIGAILATWVGSYLYGLAGLAGDHALNGCWIYRGGNMGWHTGGVKSLFQCE